jgi:hypothetical protein
LRVEHGGLVALFNFGASLRRVPLPSGSWELALDSDPQHEPAETDGVMPGKASEGSAVQVPAQGIRIYRRRS